MNDNVFVNQRRTDKQWTKTKCENINNDGQYKHYRLGNTDSTKTWDWTQIHILRLVVPQSKLVCYHVDSYI